MSKAEFLNLVGDVHFDQGMSGLDVEIAFEQSGSVLGNLEGVFSDIAPSQNLAGPAISQAFEFSERDFFRNSMWGLANNHVLDFGLHPAIKTSELCSNKINGFRTLSTGDKSGEVLQIHLQGGTVDVIFVSETRSPDPTVSIGTDGPWVDGLIRDLAREGRTVVVYYHGGLEGIPIPGRFHIERFRGWIDIGAFTVLSHHSHVLGLVESYRGSVIDYGMGNFLVNPRKWSEFHSTALLSRVHTISFHEGQPVQTFKDYRIEAAGKQAAKAVISPVSGTLVESLVERNLKLFKLVSNSSEHDSVLEIVGFLYWRILARRNTLLGVLATNPTFESPMFQSVLPIRKALRKIRRPYLRDIFLNESNRELALGGAQVSLGLVNLDKVALRKVIDLDLIPFHWKRSGVFKKWVKHERLNVGPQRGVDLSGSNQQR